MGKYKKIILFQGGVETLDYFSRRMGEEFERLGINVFYFNLKESRQQAKTVKRFIKPKETMVITFNFEGLEREEGLFSFESGYIWRGYDIPIYNILADHPYYYHDRFMDLLEDEEHNIGLLKQYHHLSIDKNHVKYMQEYYPDFTNDGFFPLAGSILNEDYNNLMDAAMENGIPIAERPRDIVFAGNYTHPSYFDKFIHQTNEEYADFYQGIIDELISNPQKTVEEAETAHCIKEMGEQSKEDMRLAMHRMIFVDLYVRNYYRGKVVSKLVNEGFRVTVVGKDWDKLDVKMPNRLEIINQCNSAECLRIIKTARLSLNVMPWFKNGAHDRVFNSILNGTVSFSDDSKFIKQVLPEGAGVFYYDLKKPDEMCKKLSNLLEDVDKLEEALVIGKNKVQKKHTWAQRAREILNLADFE